MHVTHYVSSCVLLASKIVASHNMVTALKVYKMPALIKRDESFSVYEYDNGYMLECNGRNQNDDWTTSKVIFTKAEDLMNGILELMKLPKS